VDRGKGKSKKEIFVQNVGKKHFQVDTKKEIEQKATGIPKGAV